MSSEVKTRFWMRSEFWLGSNLQRGGLFFVAAYIGWRLGTRTLSWLIDCVAANFHNDIRATFRMIPLLVLVCVICRWFHIYDTNQQGKRSFWSQNDWLLGKIWVRLLVLGCAILGGFILGQCASPLLLNFFPESIYGGVRAVAGAAPITLPTFLVLWWFRTYDARQQLQRANFEMGVKQIDIDTPISIEIGVEILKNVSKVTSFYDREIRLAFIKRLKRPVADTKANTAIKEGGYRYGYAQYMLRWMIARSVKADLNNMELRHQEFTLEEVTLLRILELSDVENPTAKTFPIDFEECKFTGDMSEDIFFEGCEDYKEQYYTPPAVF